jgi:hypothetical protein
VKFLFICLSKNTIMVLRIKKNSRKGEIEKKLKKIEAKPQGLKEFVGALKREYDGLEYQKQVRNEWR